MREQLGTDYYQFGYHSMNNVFVQPAALIRGLADTLPDNVWLMENNPVDSVDGGGPYIVRTRNGQFSADNVILANNAFARRLGFLRSRLVTIYTYAGVTPVLDAAQRGAAGPARPVGRHPRQPPGHHAAPHPWRQVHGAQRLFLRGRATAGTHGRPAARVVPAPLSAAGRA